MHRDFVNNILYGTQGGRNPGEGVFFGYQQAMKLKLDFDILNEFKVPTRMLERSTGGIYSLAFR